MQDRAYPTLAAATRIWARIGLLSFGGPAGQIALMHRILVEEQRWLGEKRFLHALNYCMLLPGPEAMQRAKQSRQALARLPAHSTQSRKSRPWTSYPRQPGKLTTRPTMPA